MTYILELFNKILHYSIKNEIEKLKASYKGNFKESTPSIHTYLKLLTLNIEGYLLTEKKNGWQVIDAHKYW